jgi:TPR repeat protein
LANFQDGLNAYDKQDYDAAFEEWQPLAKQGNADAQNNLGTMYANGKGVLKDAKQAASWYQKAAEQENCFLIPIHSLFIIF